MYIYKENEKINRDFKVTWEGVSGIVRGTYR
jgi:hypothetical protein